MGLGHWLVNLCLLNDETPIRLVMKVDEHQLFLLFSSFLFVCYLFGVFRIYRLFCLLNFRELVGLGLNGDKCRK